MDDTAAKNTPSIYYTTELKGLSPENATDDAPTTTEIANLPGSTRGGNSPRQKQGLASGNIVRVKLSQHLLSVL